MTAFRDCVQEQLEGKRVPRAKVKAALDKYDQKVAAFTDEGVPLREAEARAGDEVTRETMFRLKEDERRKMAQALKNIEIVATFNRSDLNIEPGKVAQAMLSERPDTPITSYATLRDNYRGLMLSRMTDILNEFGVKGLGIIRSEKGLEDIVRELFGQDTGGTAAKQLGKGWEAASDLSVDLFREVGGALARREDWRITQRQSPVKVANMPREKWMQLMKETADWTRIRRPDSTLVPPRDREQYLSDVYDTISTGGANKIRTDGRPQNASSGNQLDASRQLIFKDAEAWLRVHNEVGEGNIFDAMISHIESRAHDIAMMQQFGPNRATGMNVVRAMVKKKAAEQGGRAVERAEKQLKFFDEMAFRAERNNVASRDDPFASGMATLRNGITASVLQAAPLIAIPGDFLNAAHIRAFNKLPQTRTAVSWMNFMDPTNTADRQLAQRIGFVDESRLSFASAAERFGMMSTIGPQWSRRVADTALRASLLTSHTQAARFTAQMEMAATLGESAGKRFEDLPFVEWMRRNDITARDWDEMRSLAVADAPERPGVKFMMPDKAFEKLGQTRRAFELHRKFMSLMNATAKDMIPEATLETATRIQGTSQAGTIRGEALRSAAMFKSFVLSFSALHWRRALMESTKGGTVRYLGTLFLAMTSAGLIGTQMRQIADGKDPLPLDDINTWLTAAFRGGGLGIVGDFLFQGIGDDPSRMAGSILAGPATTKLFEGANLTIGNLLEALQGEDTNFQTEAIKFAKELTPGQSLWYGRLVFQRTIFDQAMKEADPRAFARAKRRQEQRVRESGSDFFFAPGDTSPERAPELF